MYNSCFICVFDGNFTSKEKSASESAKDETEQKTDTNLNTPDIDSEKVYLEQFSRTLGFQMSQLSEDITPAVIKPPQPRPRLNALSRTPSPSKENVNTPEILQQSEPAPKKEVKKVCLFGIFKYRIVLMWLAFRNPCSFNATCKNIKFTHQCY